MAKQITIDCTLITDDQTAHDVFAQAMEFPSYYGRNLDALYDCLGEVYNKTIIIMHSSHVEEKILATFSDAAEENPYLTLILD